MSARETLLVLLLIMSGTIALMLLLDRLAKWVKSILEGHE